MADTRTVDVLDPNGTKAGTAELPGEVLDAQTNVPLIHQVVVAQLAAARQGTASTKSRGDVRGGGRKPYRQKGTGRARQGSTRAPHWPGGGTYGGPQPNRDYSEKLPRKVKALARKSALNARAREDALLVVDAITMDAPKTQQLLAFLAKLGVAGRKVLILTDGQKDAVHRSARNVPHVEVLPFTDASTYHILWSDVVLVESGALQGGSAGASDLDREGEA